MGATVVGVNRRPLAEAAGRSNWLKAIEVMRSHPHMARRWVREMKVRELRG